MLRKRSKENTQDCKMEGEILDRIYIKMCNNTQDSKGFFHIYYRRTHSILTNYLTIGQEIHDRVRAIKEILSLSVKDFYKMLIENDIVVNNVISCMANTPSFVQKEEWFTGAWKYQTDKFCKEHSLIMIKEGLPVPFISELMTERARKRRFSEDLLEINAKLTGIKYTKQQLTPKLKANSETKRLLLVEEYIEPSDIC